MDGLLSLDALFTLVMIVLLQAVLGFDNLLYISIESKRVREDRQAFVRNLGIAIAVIARIALLFVIVQIVKVSQTPFVNYDWPGIFAAQFSIHSLIVLFGGIFILYTAVKEIFHMLSIEDLENPLDKKPGSVFFAILWIVLMNLVFSFDSILGAMALTDNIWIMATAIILSGIGMIWLAGHVTEFLQKNRMYEVLGLFILFVVGILLISEGGHLAHIKLLDTEVTAMSKSTFYFVILILVTIDIVQSRYRKKLTLQREAELKFAAGDGIN